MPFSKLIGLAEQKAPRPPDEDVPDVEVPQLAEHEVDIPPEPERVAVVVRVWNGSMWVDKDLGEMDLVPCECEEPDYADPYETSASFKSALPRDLERESTLYQMWQQNGWVDRRWIREKLDQGLDPEKLDKGIEDDIPILMALQGKEGGKGVGQTEGMSPGNPSNGINPSDVKGPGRPPGT